MARHDQRPRKIDMQCPACKRNDCVSCINVALVLMGREEICTCTKKFHSDEGEPNRNQILDPETGAVHAPGLTVSADGEVTMTGCQYDTDGDGNCPMPTCPSCHPEVYR